MLWEWSHAIGWVFGGLPPMVLGRLAETDYAWDWHIPTDPHVRPQIVKAMSKLLLWLEGLAVQQVELDDDGARVLHVVTDGCRVGDERAVVGRLHGSIGIVSPVEYGRTLHSAMGNARQSVRTAPQSVRPATPSGYVRNPTPDVAHQQTVRDSAPPGTLPSHL